jgi:hypothetical protein
VSLRLILCPSYLQPLDQIIEAYQDNRDTVLTCQSWIRKISRQTGVLPSSIILQGVKRSGTQPVSCGGFADIYRGWYLRQEVAMKVLRVFVTEENRKKIYRVRHADLVSDGVPC